METLKKIDDVFEKIVTYVCAALLLIIVVVTVLSVFFRYVVNSPLMWTEEACRFSAIYMVFLGSSLTIREDGHTSIDFIQTALCKTPNMKAIWFCITHLVAAIALILFFPHSITLMSSMGKTVSPALRITMNWIYLAFPIGAVLSLVAYIRTLPEYMKKIKNGEE